MKIHTFRHGETSWNAAHKCQGRSESELNDKGKAQARSKASLVSSLDIGAIYCSSAYRTRQTCALMAAHLPLRPAYKDSLREIDLGPWEKMMWSDIEQQYPEQTENFRECPALFNLPGAETYAQLLQRGVAAIEEIIETCDAQNVLLVSHGAILKTILIHYAGLGIEDIRKSPPLHNCAHSILEVDDNKVVKVTQVADTTDFDW